jgi:uncharacterized protein (TIRG00374 family)
VVCGRGWSRARAKLRYPLAPRVTTLSDSKPRGRRHLPPAARRALTVVVIALVVEYLVLPQIAGAKHTLVLLGHVKVLLVVLGAIAEAASLFSYALLTRAVLPSSGPPLSRIVRIDLSTLAVSHVVPGGTAGGTPLGLRLLNREGVSVPDATFALATQGIGSALILNAIFWLALVISIPAQGFNPLYITAALLGAFLIAAFAALVALLTRGEEWAAGVIGAAGRRIPFVGEDRAIRFVRQLANRLRSLGRDREVIRRAVLWAVGNWLGDALSLWIFVAAFGHVIDPIDLLVAYGLANILAVLPLTPGGLGIVEGVMIPALVGFGTPKGIAVLGVLGWRLFNFWLPIPTGGVAYVSLNVSGNGCKPGFLGRVRWRRRPSTRDTAPLELEAAPADRNSSVHSGRSEGGAQRVEPPAPEASTRSPSTGSSGSSSSHSAPR